LERMQLRHEALNAVFTAFQIIVVTMACAVDP
jgi:hypothetical protein